MVLQMALAVLAVPVVVVVLVELVEPELSQVAVMEAAVQLTLEPYMQEAVEPVELVPVTALVVLA
jgi:hypothetical protein